MGMGVNGGSYNWTAWRMIEASIKMVCGEWLSKARCKNGAYDLEMLGIKSWKEYDTNCLEAMNSNTHDLWPKQVALKVSREMRAVVDSGQLKREMEKAGHGDDVEWCHRFLGQFLDSIDEHPSGVMFN